jgi:GTPase
MALEVKGVIDPDQVYLDPETETGSVEYKYTLLDSSHLIIESRASQLNYRLLEGNGLATIYLGVTDNGYQLGLIEESLRQSLANLEDIVSRVDTQIGGYEIYRTDAPVETNYKQLFLSYNPPPEAVSDAPHAIEGASDSSEHNTGVSEQNSNSLKKLVSQQWKIRPIPDNEHLNETRYVAKVYLSKKSSVNRETRVVVMGHVDSGKSTLIGVLTKNELDNGNGSARASVFNHPHEIQSGRTSSVSQQLLGLSSEGKIVNTHRLAQTDLVQQSNHLVSLYDLAGHLKYLNTTVRGVCGQYPDHALVIVGGNMGVMEMTKEHIVLAYLHKIPMTIVITKIDIAPEQKLQHTMAVIKNLLKSVNYQVLVIKSKADLDFYRRQTSRDLVPIIMISNVKGTNLEFLTELIHTIPKKNDFAKRILEPFYSSISETFSVPGVGTVVSNLVIAGKSTNKATHWIGPFYDGRFKKIHVRSIQNKRVNVDQCQADQTVTFAIRGVERREILKGMVLIDGKSPEPIGKKRYWAELTIIGRHSTSIKEFYEPIINLANIRQAAKILTITDIKRGNKPMTAEQQEEFERAKEKGEIDKICLRSGDSAKILMEFKFRPVHVLPGSLLMFREQKVKGWGVILPDQE